MHTAIIALALPAWLLLAPAALAAPTCLTIDGETTKCGVDGAMPVGWQLPSDQAEARLMASRSGESSATVLKVAFGIGLLLALIALMPEFDGSRAGDWDTQEDDDPWA
jgi:hypothetical protein